MTTILITMLLTTLLVVPLAWARGYMDGLDKKGKTIGNI